ncbi:unnamed protein product, partial [Brassica oleracea]
ILQYSVNQNKHKPHKHKLNVTLVASATSVLILLNGDRRVNRREVRLLERLLLTHHLRHVLLLQQITPYRRTVSPLISTVVHDVVHRLGIRGRHDRLLIDRGGASDPILRRLRNGFEVLRVSARSGYLPWLLDVTPESLRKGRSRRRRCRWFRHC